MKVSQHALQKKKTCLTLHLLKRGDGSVRRNVVLAEMSCFFFLTLQIPFMMTVEF